ncbi:unnamed protein product [Meloidogyne enterolobii]|uniref:Uncharacterized protein n=1 Tax=Meloidogyne enterolobii TaxID=390850 RepID=A0ACB0YAA2_MELEN
MKIIMDEYQHGKLENKIALNFLVWVFWVEKQFKEMKEENKEEIKYLNKMWLFRRGYFYSKYDELFELNDKNKLEKEGNLMSKIQFGIWKNLKEKKLKKKNWEKEWRDIENGIIRVKKEEEEEFEEFLNKEKKKVLKKEIKWEEEEENLEEKEGRKNFYKFVIEALSKEIRRKRLEDLIGILNTKEIIKNIKNKLINKYLKLENYEKEFLIEIEKIKEEFEKIEKKIEIEKEEEREEDEINKIKEDEIINEEKDNENNTKLVNKKFIENYK